MNVNDAQSYTDTTSNNSRVASNDNSAASMNNLFMTLLVAQIQNQDPLNPTDGTEYVSQLAQLSQVQSMESMSALMQNNAVLMDNLQTLSTGNLVGQKVMVQTDKIETDGSTVIDGRLSLITPQAWSRCTSKMKPVPSTKLSWASRKPDRLISKLTRKSWALPKASTR